MQAEAAGIEPSVRMNPILLKPTSDVGSQVIVNGEVRQNMRAAEYFKYKKSLIPDIMAAYNSLAAENDIIVVEGAGSPAEINLKSEDIVNMGLAKMLKAPVLLAGDIDRGGVFAQLVGTMMLLEKEEQQMVKGLIINKFRGDKRILDPGIEMLKDYTPVPVVGVVPYMHVDIDDEDSLADRLDKHTEKGLIDIAVIRVPRMSNFTDFNALERMQGVTQMCIRDRIVYFSPLTDAALPENLSGLYMGGGYPELHGEQLSQNASMKQSIREAVEGGMPCLAECGAFMYLHEAMEDADGRFWPMVGLVPGKAVKKGRLVRFGYAVLTSETDTILGPKGLQMPVHEFHYWDTTCEEGCFEAHKPLTERRWHCMYQKKQLLAGFPHFYFQADEEMALHYVEACRNYADGYL